MKAIRFIHIFFYVSIPIFSLVLMGMSIRYQKKKLCQNVNIRIENEADNLFLDVEKIKRVIASEENLMETPVRAISLTSVENKLIATNFVDHAEAYFSPRGNLNLDVELRQPIARVVTSKNESFYIDKNLLKMPLNPHFAARSILVRGNFKEKYYSLFVQDSILQTVLPLLSYIDSHPLVKSQISELVVNRDGEILIYPEIGSLKIEFGSVENFQQKFDHLLLFYKEVLSKTGWSYYSKVNLKYKNQVVAVKAKNSQTEN